MADQVDFDLYAGTGLSPMIRPNPLKNADEYMGSYEEYKKARVDADFLRDSGNFDWWVIMLGETNYYASWSSGLTGPRQKKVTP